MAKTCPSCQETKPDSEFYPRQARCRDCLSNYNKKWRRSFDDEWLAGAITKEKMAEVNRLWIVR